VQFVTFTTSDTQSSAVLTFRPTKIITAWRNFELFSQRPGVAAHLRRSSKTFACVKVQLI
jgi:hypothetical protein